MTAPVDGVPQLGDAAHIHLVPSAEGELAHLAPERAAGERLTAAAELSVGDPALPQVDDLTDRADAGQLAKQPL